MPVETSRPVAGQLIMMIPMIPSSALASIHAHEHVVGVTRHATQEISATWETCGKRKGPRCPTLRCEAKRAPPRVASQALSVQTGPLEKAIAIAGGDAHFEGATVAVDRQRHFHAGPTERP